MQLESSLSTNIDRKAQDGDVMTSVNDTSEIRHHLNESLKVDPIVETGREQSDWSVSTAARYFKKSPRQIQRLLKCGQLKGYKIAGPKGPEWRVHPVDSRSQRNFEQALIDRLCDLDGKLDDIARELQLLESKSARCEAEIERLKEAVPLAADIKGDVTRLSDRVSASERVAADLQSWKKQQEVVQTIVTELDVQRKQIKALAEKQSRGSWWQLSFKE